MPSERAKAAGAPVEVDISKLEPGMLLMVEWRGKVVWVLKRTPEMLASLTKIEGELADPASEKKQQPEYAKNATRSIKSEILVVEGVCTHLGCSPVFRKDIAPADLGPDWQGGFSVHAMAQNLIWLVVSTKAFLHQQIWLFLLIPILLTVNF